MYQEVNFDGLVGPTHNYAGLSFGNQASMRNRAAVSKLSAEHREIIDLVYYHEKSVEEVAEIVGIPENTVKTRMFHAREKLRRLLPKLAGVEAS